MPILVTCKCGKKFRADEKHSGKQTTCPKCSQALDITGPIVSAYDVFVSYSSNDKITCDALCATFEGRGLRCWIAPRDILPGMNWGEAIISGIEQCRVMVLVFSAHSNESPQVKREVERAVSKGLPVIPLRIEDVKLSRAMEYFISSQHWLDALTPPLENHLTELARKVSKLLADDNIASAPEPNQSGPESMPMARPILNPPAPAAQSPTATMNQFEIAATWPGIQPSDSPRSEIALPNSLSAIPTYPRGRSSHRKTWWENLPIHWRWTAFGGSVVALFCLTLFLLRIPPASGTIRLDIADLTANVSVKIDGDAITASQLSRPLRLKLGEHRVEVTGSDIESASKSFTIEKGENRQIELALVSKPRLKESNAIASKPRRQSVPTDNVVKQPTVSAETAVSKNVSPMPANPKSIVPSDAIPFQGHSYKYFGEKLSWKDAKLRCDSLGGHLPIIETAAENTFLDQLADKGFPSAGRNGTESVWLGATDEANEGEWRWIDGVRVTYTNWLDNQPGNHNGQEHYAQLCLYRNPNRASGGWADLPNMSKDLMVHFICEWDSIAFATTAEPIPNNAGAPTAIAWTDLFNGLDSTGWSAPVLPNNWEVRDGVIVGKGMGLSALFAKATYDDFELELEYKLTSGSNSGIWIRTPNNTEAGFDGAKRAMSISLLDDAAPIWANDIKDFSKRTGGLHLVAGPNPFPTAPAGEWNHLLIRAVGPQVVVKINGVQVLDVNTADHFARLPECTGLTRTSGYIGLEDHGEDGVEFRDIRIRKLSAESAAVPEAEWFDLFNGKDLTGWTPLASKGAWSVKNGILTATSGEGSLLTDRDFSDFELELEYRLSKKANSGVFIRAPSGFDPSGSGLLEIQLQDDGAFPPGDVIPLTRTGSVFRIIPAAKIVKAPSEAWNTLSIRANGPQITVGVNGQTTVDANLNDYALLTKDKPNTTRLSGRIGLQRRANSVEFRNVRIRELNEIN